MFAMTETCRPASPFAERRSFQAPRSCVRLLRNSPADHGGVGAAPAPKARHVSCTFVRMHRNLRPRPLRAAACLKRETQGDAAVEYLFLIGTVALPAIAAFVAVGKVIVDNYTTMQNILILPLP
jgi:Flp pilus assembly pilin Flp